MTTSHDDVVLVTFCAMLMLLLFFNDGSARCMVMSIVGVGLIVLYELEKLNRNMEAKKVKRK